MYELTIVADCNDCDLVDSTSLVTEEELHQLIPLLERIMASGDHNFVTLGMLDGESDPTTQYPDVDPKLIEKLCELVPSGECDYGIHTIHSASYCLAPERTVIKGSC
jgi:hypothetical protein